MATAAVGIAPVLTPKTVGALAEALEQAHLTEMALSLRNLQPFIGGVVEKYFVPLSSPARKGAFAARLTKLARDFEPSRVYLNIRLLSTFQDRDFVGTYERILLDVLGSLMSTAHEMEMAPELLSAALHDYVKIIQVLVDSANSSPQTAELTIEQFEALVDWFHWATRFDYGLTAIFLILERAIPKPSAIDKVSLLLFCRKTLVEFARATSKIFVGTQANHALKDLETPRLEITAIGKKFQVNSAHRELLVPTKATFGSLRRQTEIDWLTRNNQVSDEYGGKWVV